jgi:predicted PurR-regulated permease PerM
VSSSADSSRHRTTVEVPWRTIFKLFAAAALVWLWLTLFDLILVVIVAVLIAVTLNPIVEWFERRGLPRWAASAAVALILIATVGGLLWLTWASLADQMTYVGTQLRETEGDLLVNVPQWLRNAVGIKPGDTLYSYVSPYAARVGQSAVSAVVVTLLGFVLTLYLLIEAKATREWLLAFVPKSKRPRVEQTLTECQRIIFAYAAGNFITSVIAAVTTLIALSLLKVPAALLLAVIAGISDFVPVAGFVLGAVPTILMALTVSGKTALIVAAFYLAYNTVENYLISPWAYAGRLELSNVAVILAFVVGGEVAGVIGALIALPVAAAYPAIERIWLRKQLPDETVKEHEELKADS